MLSLHQEGPASRLTPVVENEVLVAGVLEGVRNAQAYALARSREPFRALNYRGTVAWHEALLEVGKVLDEFGWTFNREIQPTFSAPPNLLQGELELFIFHGHCVANEIHTARRGKSTLDKLRANAYQFALDFGEEAPVVSPGTLFACLVMERNDSLNEVRVYLALGREVEETRILCEEIILLNENPIALDSPLADNATVVGPVAPAIEPQIDDLERAG